MTQQGSGIPSMSTSTAAAGAAATDTTGPATAANGFVNTGHRGAMGLEPENTMRSFRRAVADGATEIELDVRVSRDGTLVIMHDATVDRTTSGTGTVADLTLAELRELDAGHGERIPTYAEVLDEVPLPLQTEVKTADAVGPLLELFAARPELRERVILTSFHADWLAALTREQPDLPVGFITRPSTYDAVDTALALRAQRIFFAWQGLDKGLVDHAHGHGLKVASWLANSDEDFARAYAFGVDGVTTDFPHLYRPADGVAAAGTMTA